MGHGEDYGNRWWSAYSSGALVGKFRFLPRFEQSIKQGGFLALNAYHFCAHAWAAHELFNELIMCVTDKHNGES